jgi:hypothetical protein
VKSSISAPHAHRFPTTHPPVHAIDERFSKKIENHAHAVAIHYTHYNWCRIHKTLRVTPAIEAGLTDHVWSLEELVGLLDRRPAR